jgi:hypothetical protein
MHHFERIIMERRNFIRLVGGGTVLAATATLGGCASSAFPAQAVEAWKGPAASERDPRRWALAHAITAPNPHNLQPWLVDLRERDVITVYTDPQRVLSETDPFGRQILIGHGAFLELLVMALAQRSLQAEVSLWPQGEMPASLKAWDKRPIARLTLKAGATPDPLYTQIFKRHTTKVPFDVQRAVPSEALNALQTAVAGRSPRLQLTNATERVTSLRELCLKAAEAEFGTARTVSETKRLLRIGPDEILANRDGVSVNTPMLRLIESVGLFDRSAAPQAGDTMYKETMKRYADYTNTAMGFIWLSAPNTRHGQVDAGRAYIRLQLKATELGIGMHPLSQSLQEFPEMRVHYERVHQMLLGKAAPSVATDEAIQMLCRIGYVNDSVQASPRRALEKFILTA